MCVAICRDGGEAALVRSVLTAHGIHVHISGEHHAAMVGLGAAAIRMDVTVARADAEEAIALIAELREGSAAALADGEIPPDDDSERDDEASPGGPLVVSGPDTLTRLGTRKRMALAVLVGLTLMHGTAHFSARAWKRGIVCAAVQVLSWRYFFAGHGKTGAALMAVAIAADVIGALFVLARTEPPAGVPAARALPKPP